MTRVLVVDDDPLIRPLVSELLYEEGFDVDTATQGAEGLAKLRTQPYDGVVLDMMMPVMDGLAVLRAMRQDQILAQVPVLCLTAAPLLADQATRLGAEACMTKPFDLDSLLDAVQRLVEPDQASGTPTAWLS